MGGEPPDPLTVAVVGAGRVGTALAVLLARAGHQVVVAGREGSRARVERHLPGAPFLTATEAAGRADVVVLAVSDDAIEDVCGAVAGSLGPGRAAVHLSGSASLAVLDQAARGGTTVLSLHPLQTVPDVDSGIARLPGSAMAVTAREEAGYRLGERLAAAAGGRSFRLPDDRKSLYHAAAVFCSNYLAVVEGVAERLFGAAGIPEPLALLAPLARATLDNVLEEGPARALTGPAARGDAGSVRRNLEALSADAPDVVQAYVALARAALDLAEAAGRLDGPARARVEEVLAGWT